MKERTIAEHESEPSVHRVRYLYVGALAITALAFAKIIHDFPLPFDPILIAIDSALGFGALLSWLFAIGQHAPKVRVVTRHAMRWGLVGSWTAGVITVAVTTILIPSNQGPLMVLFFAPIGFVVGAFLGACYGICDLADQLQP